MWYFTVTAGFQSEQITLSQVNQSKIKFWGFICDSLHHTLWENGVMFPLSISFSCCPGLIDVCLRLILSFSCSNTAMVASTPLVGSVTFSSVSILAGGSRGWTHHSSLRRCRATLSPLMQVKKNSSNTAVQKSSCSNSSCWGGNKIWFLLQYWLIDFLTINL